jgi:hypothetical protein
MAFIALPEPDPFVMRPSKLRQYFAIAYPRNGEVISKLVEDLCRDPMTGPVLFIRTPTTGAWLDSMKLPRGSTPHWLRYTSSQAAPGGAFITRDQYLAALRKLARDGCVFNLIVIDPAHDYASSLEDFEMCLPLLSGQGVLLSHDCAPSRPEMAAATFTRGAWSGQTYAALATVAHRHSSLNVRVLDTDTGIGVIQQGAQALPDRLSVVLRPLRDRLRTRFHRRLLSMIHLGVDLEAYRYFRRHGAILVGLEKNRRHQFRRILLSIRTKWFRRMLRAPEPASSVDPIRKAPP